MKVTEVFRAVMAIRSVRVTDLALRLGMKQNALSNRLARENISIENLVETMNAMDYKVVVLPNTARIPENGFEIR